MSNRSGGQNILLLFVPEFNAEYEDFLNRLKASVMASPVPVIVAGDFNAKYWLWGSPANDYRGEALADLAQAMDLTICNQGSSPTREKDDYQSYIDITMACAQ